MRLELTRVGLLVQLANHYTTRGALLTVCPLSHFPSLTVKNGDQKEESFTLHLFIFPFLILLNILGLNIKAIDLWSVINLRQCPIKKCYHFFSTLTMHMPSSHQPNTCAQILTVFWRRMLLVFWIG